MTDRNGIVKALKHLGVPEDKIQIALEEALSLQGYGRQTKKVEMLVANKDYHSGYSDFGFSKENGNKEYSMFVDDMDDVGALAKKAGVTGKFSESVNQWYSAFKAQEALKKQGLYAKIKQNGDQVVVVAQG